MADVERCMDCQNSNRFLNLPLTVDAGLTLFSTSKNVSVHGNIMASDVLIIAEKHGRVTVSIHRLTWLLPHKYQHTQYRTTCRTTTKMNYPPSGDFRSCD